MGTRERNWDYLKKQFCPKGHDTFIVGRSKSNGCNECQRQRVTTRGKIHPKKGVVKKLVCSHGHLLSVRGRTLLGQCVACKAIETKLFNRKRIALAKSLLGSRCNCPGCDEKESQFLEFDHVDNDGFMENYKSANVSARFVINNPGQTKLQLLCSNCNHGKRMNNGICPHISSSSTQAVKRLPRKRGNRPTTQHCVHGHIFSIVGRTPKGKCRECVRIQSAIGQEIVVRAKRVLGNVCNCPGCSVEELLFLNFDHINNDGHLEVNRSCGSNSARYILKNPDQTRFQLLCANCNHGKRMNGGVCPHITKGEV